MDAAKVAELKRFVDKCKSDPSILNDPSFSFFKTYLESLGARISPEMKSDKADTNMSNSGQYMDSEKPDEDGDALVESDIELDETDVVEPDNDPPQQVEPNVHKIEQHCRKYECLKKERDLKKAETERKRRAEAEAWESLSALMEGQVMGVHASSELEMKLNAASRTSRLAILYFTATWCGPCRFISPLFTSLATKYPQVVFLKADIDEARDVAARWNINSVPTFFFIKNGKEIDKVVGADKNGLERKIAQHASQYFVEIFACGAKTCLLFVFNNATCGYKGDSVGLFNK